MEVMIMCECVNRPGVPDHYAWQAAGLTPREAEVLELIAQGKQDPTIAHELGVGLSTVKFHGNHLRLKLDVNSRMLLARWWWVHVERPQRAAA